MKLIFLALCLFVQGFALAADVNSLVKTKTKIIQLDAQIKKLKLNLTNDQDIRQVLTKELAVTEKQMSESIRQLRTIQHDIDIKQQKIIHFKKQEEDLNKELLNQQVLLADHVKTFYKMGEYQPLKWVLNQDDPYTINRLLTFYQYLVRSRQDIIDDISATKENLLITQTQLQHEMGEQRNLQENLHRNQLKLKHNKTYHEAVIQSLNNEIQSKERRLNDFQTNKDNLANILKTLINQNSTFSAHAFTSSKHKLPLPVQINRLAIRAVNQGVSFFVPEGTPVAAVSAGRVVFSDWLNGYGLLLIIDHGQGFMTLYAHNQSLYKSRGSFVERGETVAAVGHSGGVKQNGLYFEIRKRGKAVPPLSMFF